MHGQARQMSIWDAQERVLMGVAEPEDYQLANARPARYGWRDALDLVGLFAFFILVGML